MDNGGIVFVKAREIVWIVLIMKKLQIQTAQILNA